MKSPDVSPDTIQQSRAARNGWLPLAGFLALLWFLCRVLPKPARAAYPCQRAAFPLASAFVLWLVALLGCRWSWRQAVAAWSWRRLLSAGVFASLAFAGGLVCLSHLPKPSARAANPTDHQPVGKGRGVMPGRVVWVHAPEATEWAGETSGKRSLEPAATHQPTVEAMLEKAICRLAEQTDPYSAWDAMFRHFNRESGRGEVGYARGEKIMIKINLTLENAGMGSLDANYNKVKSSWYRDIWNNTDPSPQLLLALLRQLVYVVGVDPSDLSVGDPVCLVPNDIWNLVHPEFPEVRFVENKGAKGRSRVEFSDRRMHWSTPEGEGKVEDFIPDCYAEATYVINNAIPKSHSFGGITASAKNHYGSLLRTPVGALRDAGTLDYYNMHHSLLETGEGGVPGMGHYRSLVDLTGHPDLGGKTLLYLHDLLYSGQGWEGNPKKWQMDPFHNDWPSSIFVSMDPVAIDSVAFDFLSNEWPDLVLAEQFSGGAEDYLHEAATADDPPSGTIYDPAGSGRRLASLGVHEHWNNPLDRQYSRNLGKPEGIELISLPMGRVPEPRPGIYAEGSSGDRLQLTLNRLIPGKSYVLERISPGDGTTTPIQSWTNYTSYGASWSGQVTEDELQLFRVRQLP